MKTVDMNPETFNDREQVLWHLGYQVATAARYWRAAAWCAIAGNVIQFVASVWL